MKFFLGAIIGAITSGVLIVIFDLITNRHNKKRWIEVRKIKNDKSD